MKKLFLTTAAALVAATACQEATTPASDLALSMASVYSSAPTGFAELNTSFDASGSPGGAFIPGFEHGMGGGHGGMGGPGFGGPGFGLGMMGGGLGGPFMGGGMDGGHFHPSTASCTFAATIGVTCTDTTRDGLIVKRVSKYTTTAGVVQQAIDSTTNTVVTTVTVSGTATRRDSSKSVVASSSTQTVTGLAKGSASRTVNGASAGTENTTGTSPQGAFTSKRVAGDTVRAVVIPTATTANPRPYPTAGTVIRAMSATVTITGQSATTTSRREVVTYDGSATAKVVITKDGVTQNCTLPLPFGHLTCS